MPATPAHPVTSSSSPIWKRNEFHTFYAKMKIRVGGSGAQQVVDIQKGDDFEYDGTTCRYAGSEFAQPSLRKAIIAGWATPDVAGDTPVPFVASRDVAVSQSKSRDLSRVQRRAHHNMDTDSLDEETVLEVSDRSNARDPRTGQGHLTASDNRRAHKPGTLRLDASDLDDQDAVTVSRIRTAAKSRPVDIIANPGKARDVELDVAYENGFGQSKPIHNPRQNVINREGVTITSNVGDMDRSGSVEYGDESDGEIVGKVRHSSARERSVEGITVKDGNRAAKPARAAKPEPAVPAKKPSQHIPDDASPKLKLALRIYSDFPVDWNFFAKSDDKVKRIKALGAAPELLDALYSIESPAMKKVMEQKFKSHFA